MYLLSMYSRWTLPRAEDSGAAAPQEVTFLRALALLLRSGSNILMRLGCSCVFGFIHSHRVVAMTGLAAAGEATSIVPAPVASEDTRLPVTLADYTSAARRTDTPTPTTMTTTSTATIDTAADTAAAGAAPPLPVPKAGFPLTRGGPPLRLYDTYATAFQRVIDTCFREISTRGGLIPPR